ncbi:THAP domain-containing protein 10-like [Montipora capricornis]|uniref:THAP domain-containing protein 10-like n=1 Tax=Montipora capricornis TaxID=246305 RepID=UPI0035F15D85
MPHRCVAGGCSNTRKNRVSLHQWPEDLHFARLWTNAVKNTLSDFYYHTNSSRLCSAYFTEDCFEAQTVIAKSLGLRMKNSIKADAVPTIFKIRPPQTKKSRRDGDSDNGTFDTSEVKSNPPRGAYGKREAAWIIDESVRKESSTSGKQKDDAEATEEKSEPKVKEASTQIQSSKKNVSVQFRSKHRSKGKFRLRRMVKNEYRLK